MNATATPRRTRPAHGGRHSAPDDDPGPGTNPLLPVAPTTDPLLPVAPTTDPLLPVAPSTEPIPRQAAATRPPAPTRP